MVTRFAKIKIWVEVYSVWYLTTKSRYYWFKWNTERFALKTSCWKKNSNRFGGFLLYLTCVQLYRVCSNEQHILELVIFVTYFKSVVLILNIYHSIIIGNQLVDYVIQMVWFLDLKTNFTKVNVHNDVYLYSNFFFRYLAKTFPSLSTIKNIFVFALNSIDNDQTIWSK